MKLTIVRHGETIQNAAKIIQGQLDGELSELGLHQVQAAARQISDAEEQTRKQAGIIFSSDLGRCVQTAEVIKKLMPVTDIVETAVLREFSYGDYQGMPRESLRWGALPGNAWTRKVEGGESWADVRSRVLPYMRSIIHAYAEVSPLASDSVPDPVVPEINTLIVTHGGPMKLFRTALLGRHASEPPFDFSVSNAEIWDIDLEVTRGEYYSDRTVRLAAFIVHTLDDSTMLYESEQLA